jgi:hypothetical protein
MTPQQQKIIELHKDRMWHCSTEIEYIRDARKRISELNIAEREKTGHDLFEKAICTLHSNHSSQLLMRRITKVPEESTNLTSGNYQSRRVFNNMIVSAYKKEVLEAKELERSKLSLFN